MSDRSRDVRKSFSAKESYQFFFYIKDLKLSSEVCFAVAIFFDKYFWEVAYMKDETGQKSGSDDKTEQKTLSFLCRTIIGNIVKLLMLTQARRKRRAGCRGLELHVAMDIAYEI